MSPTISSGKISIHRFFKDSAPNFDVFVFIE